MTYRWWFKHFVVSLRKKFKGKAKKEVKNLDQASHFKNLVLLAFLPFIEFLGHKAKKDSYRNLLTNLSQSLGLLVSSSASLYALFDFEKFKTLFTTLYSCFFVKKDCKNCGEPNSFFIFNVFFRCKGCVHTVKISDVKVAMTFFGNFTTMKDIKDNLFKLFKEIWSHKIDLLVNMALATAIIVVVILFAVIPISYIVAFYYVQENPTNTFKFKSEFVKGKDGKLKEGRRRRGKGRMLRRTNNRTIEDEYLYDEDGNVQVICGVCQEPGHTHRHCPNEQFFYDDAEEDFDLRLGRRARRNGRINRAHDLYDEFDDWDEYRYYVPGEEDFMDDYGHHEPDIMKQRKKKISEKEMRRTIVFSYKPDDSADEEYFVSMPDGELMLLGVSPDEFFNSFEVSNDDPIRNASEVEVNMTNTSATLSLPTSSTSPVEDVSPFVPKVEDIKKDSKVGSKKTKRNNRKRKEKKKKKKELVKSVVVQPIKESVKPVEEAKSVENIRRQSGAGEKGKEKIDSDGNPIKFIYPCHDSACPGWNGVQSPCQRDHSERALCKFGKKCKFIEKCWKAHFDSKESRGLNPAFTDAYKKKMVYIRTEAPMFGSGFIVKGFNKTLMFTAYHNCIDKEYSVRGNDWKFVPITVYALDGTQLIVLEKPEFFDQVKDIAIYDISSKLNHLQGFQLAYPDSSVVPICMGYYATDNSLTPTEFKTCSGNATMSGESLVYQSLSTEPGSSGSAIIDGKGSVIGIHTDGKSLGGKGLRLSFSWLNTLLSSKN
jgi:hypothetical protein